ncbi:hypothetical protein EYF80_001167 [Liparis tanakae]|uniref:Uncharacterized protein n=1 Tax=Liparis tanakae TaxID=230148 RepID=A0A4Z2JDM6_9TELE|nr:hypothetical protein EYF80_001167 [Liparis tanakae]
MFECLTFSFCRLKRQRHAVLVWGSQPEHLPLLPQRPVLPGRAELNGTQTTHSLLELPSSSPCPGCGVAMLHIVILGTLGSQFKCFPLFLPSRPRPENPVDGAR